MNLLVPRRTLFSEISKTVLFYQFVCFFENFQKSIYVPFFVSCALGNVLVLIFVVGVLGVCLSPLTRHLKVRQVHCLLFAKLRVPTSSWRDIGVLAMERSESSDTGSSLRFSLPLDTLFFTLFPRLSLRWFLPVCFFLSAICSRNMNCLRAMCCILCMIIL